MRCIKQLAITALSLVLVSGAAFAAEEQTKKQIKDKTVKTLMNFAFSLMPEVYTGPDGKKITIDKKKPETVLIPVDDARRIIIVGDRSARAQNCDLKVMQTLNHNAMVKYEQVFKNWSVEQKLFINQLHLFTVLYMTGNVKFGEYDDKKPPVNSKQKPNLENKHACSDAQRKTIAKSIDDYLDEITNSIGEELKRRGKLGSNEKKNEEVKKAQK